MRVSVCLGAILIPEFLDFHSAHSTPRSRIAGIYSGIYSGIIRNIPNERALGVMGLIAHLLSPIRYRMKSLAFVSAQIQFGHLWKASVTWSESLSYFSHFRQYL